MIIEEISVRIENDIASINPIEWDELAHGLPFQGYRWFEYAQVVCNKDVPYYILTYQGEKLIARCVFWLRYEEDIPDVSPFINSVLQKIISLRPILIAEIPLLSASSLVLPAEPVLRKQSFALIVEETRKIARAAKVSFVIMNYLTAEFARDALWSDLFQLVQLPSDTVLDLREIDTYDAYLASLNKKRRKNLRRNRDKALGYGLSIDFHDCIEDVDLTMTLLDNVFKKYGGSESATKVRRFIEYAHMVNVRWLTARRDNKIIGCEVMIGDSDVWRVTRAGNDYSTDLTYMLLSYEDIRLAIEMGAKELRAGAYLYEVKRRMGYQMADDGYIRFFAANRVLSWFIKIISPFGIHG